MLALRNSNTLRSITGPIAILIAVVGLLVTPTTQADTPDLATVHTNSSSIEFLANVPNDGLVLSVSLPSGTVEHQKASGSSVSFALDGREDGTFTWQLEVLPIVAPATRQALLRARESNDKAAVDRLRARGLIPAEPKMISGSFRILGGSLVESHASEEDASASSQSSVTTESSSAPRGTETPSLDNAALADQVILDDLIVDGSACVGTDCVNGESFSFDTIRLKENTIRIRFVDTSTSPSYPKVDWQLTANDSSSGGLDKFSIDDIDNSRTPFTIEARAPNHSLYVDDFGRIGLGTSTPSVDFQATDGDTPALRLEQNGSSGFIPQTWDIAGNDSNFFVRDVTHGSQLPLRIRPAAPTSSLDISGNGYIGMGTASPSSALHIYREDGTAKLLVEDDGTVEGVHTLMQLTNNGRVRWQMTDTSSNGQQWTFFSSEDKFNISSGSNAGQEFVLDGSGNLEISGMLDEGSDRNIKENFQTLNSNEVLERVANLPITRWNYRHQAESIQHIGPMAQDWYEAFKTGADNLHIAPSDKASVALVSIQALYARLLEKQDELETLKSQNNELLSRLEALEARLP